MNFTYESQGTNTFLVYQITPEDMIDSMSLGMMTNNKVAGFAPMLFTQMDADRFLKYNVSAKVSVSQFFSGPVSKKRLLGVFTSIVNALLNAEDYMIATETILLNLDYIFVDVSTCEALLICLPICGIQGENKQIGSFFKDIIFCTQFDQTENCDHVAKIMNYLNSTPVFSLESFKELLNTLKTSATPEVQVKYQTVIKHSSSAEQPDLRTFQKNMPTKTQTAPPAPQATGASAANAPSSASQQDYSVGNATGSAVDSDEEKIGVWNLLTHYSKENAAKYKAQKAIEKKQPEKKSKEKKQSDKKHPAKPTTNAAAPRFAVPGQPVVESRNNIVVPSPIVTPKMTPTPVAPSVQQMAQSNVQTMMPQSHPMNFGETTILNVGGSSETTILVTNAANRNLQPYLVRLKTNETIPLNKPVFRIGKERSYVDYFVGDNTAVSRSHANFVTRDQSYYVVDTNSTNHTYLNGVMIQSNVETALSQGDRIRLANEEFEFKLL